MTGRAAEEGRSFTIVPRGPFSLQELATFGFGQRAGEDFDGVMRLAFCMDNYRDQVGVEIREDASGVHGIVVGEGDLPAVARQVSRVLSLDHDGDAFLRVGERDPVIGRLQAASPGLRPPLFYSPYEAAAWSIIGARRPARQMAEVRRRMSETYGRVFELAGQQLAALPTPDRMVAIESFPGLTEDKIDRLHGVARAALSGQLDIDRISAMDPAEAMADLQTIKGIGPFYGALIVIRAAGHADVLPTNEPKSLELTAALYGLPRPPTPVEFEAMAAPWRPFRTWAAVLIRAAGPAVLAEQPRRQTDG